MFKSKAMQMVGLVLAFIAFAVPVGYSVYDSNDVAPYTPVVEGSGILGPQTANVGEMVRLSASGEQVEWKCLPENKNIQVYGDNNNNLVASFEAPGVYTIFAARNEGGELHADLIQINVGGVAPPKPVTPGTPAPVTGELSAQVSSWCKAAAVDKTAAGNLAANFETAASEINLGTLKDAQSIIARTAELNATLTLKGFDPVMGQLQAYLTTESDAGRLVTAEQHNIVWRQIAAGLKEYSSN